MKKITKILSAIVLTLTCVLTLTACNNQIGVYNVYHRNDSTLSKNHVYTEVSVKKVISIVSEAKDKGTETNKEYTYVFLGTPTDSKSKEVIAIFNEQAKQFGIETVYYVDSKLSDSKLESLKTAFGMKRYKHVPALFVFVNGTLKFDSTDSKYETTEAAKLATEAFRDTK